MILAIDSSTGTSAAVVSVSGVTRWEASSDNPRGHSEVVGDLITEVLSGAGATPDQLTAVVMGVGPGPFTGLRVGMAAVAAVSWGRSIPLWPVVSMDAGAYGKTGRVLVWSDQKRRERAWTVYSMEGGLPLAEAPPALHDVATFSDLLSRHGDCDVVELTSVVAADLARVAIERIQRGLEVADPKALYLRAPDVTPRP
jgi:tRNA threonylcarbamoyladenosine biosynthesis protein TsaB